MNAAKTILALAVVGAVGAGAYWAGSRARPGDMAQADAAAPAASGAATVKARKLLYYRNPMGLPDTSPVPKKDQMGMDYIAVYEGEDEEAAAPGAASQIRISTEKVQKLGVRTEAASKRELPRSVRASGRVEPDERRMAVVSPKFEGYVERLHVNTTGQPVAKGQVLFEVYSADLVSAQREYMIAMQGVAAMKGAGAEAQRGMQQLADSALLHLRHWDVSAEQIDALVKTGEVRRTVSFRSPVAGVVTEKKAVQGMRFMPGEMLYQVTDLSAVWVVADVFEQDIAMVKLGAKARVSFNAYGGQNFDGTITYIYPTLKAETRTVPVRIELANPRGLLKPAMFAQVDLQVGAKAAVLTVPDSAVIDTGMRRIVLVQLQEGRFEPREVKLGARNDSHVEVLEGVREGEQVVVAANFLIDAESNLKAVIGGMSGPQAAASAPAAGMPAKAVGHQASGTVDSVDDKAGTVTLNHGPVASLKWPAMTMDFTLANPALMKGLKPGVALDFEFVERGKGEWVVTSVKLGKAAPPPAAPKPAPAPAPKPHSGH